MFRDAKEFGFLPTATPQENSVALQKALDMQGTITVSVAGIYEVSTTIFIDSNTTIIFGNGVFIKKSALVPPFCHVFLNRGALTKEYNEHIVVEGLNLIVNSVDKVFDQIHGLRGQLAFYYIRDLHIKNFRCLDLANAQFCIHISNFEDVIIENVIIKGDKDAIHFGPGRRFVVRDGKFETYDDAIALNAQDYSSSNPELGWIENGVIENCYDLAGRASQLNKLPAGFFCRMIAGAWVDWYEGMSVQQSDTVVANGRLYRVQMQADGKSYISNTKPNHTAGQMIYDGITWGVAQESVIYTCGVKNVVFRDIFIEQKRIPFSVLFDNDKYNRCYYPNAETPITKNIIIENLNILHSSDIPLLEISGPLSDITILNSNIYNNRLIFQQPVDIVNYGKCSLIMANCKFLSCTPQALLETQDRELELVLNGCTVIE